MGKKNSEKKKKPRGSEGSVASGPRGVAGATKCVPGGAGATVPRDDACFEPLKLEVQQPETAVLLLGSAERPVLLAAASALASYGARSRREFERLFEEGLAEPILGLVGHEELVTRRFALKLLAMMSAAGSVRRLLLRDSERWLGFFASILATESDVFLQEFSSRILAELCAEPEGAARFIAGQSQHVDCLFERIAAEDPDVKKNSIEIIRNLLKDIDGLDFVLEKSYIFEPIYKLLDEPFPVIQELALNVLELLVSHSEDERVQQSFRLSGPLRLLDLLANNDCQDLHELTLKVLTLACENETTAKYLNATTATKELFDFIRAQREDKLKHQTLSILVRLADDPAGKKLLQLQGFVGFLSSCMDKSQPADARASVCEGFAKMSRYPPAAVEIVNEDDVFDFILHLLNDEQAKWSEREAAAAALKELFQADFQNCLNFVENARLLPSLTSIIQLPAASMPWEVKAIVIQAVSALAAYAGLVPDLIDYDLLSALSSLLDIEHNIDDELRIASCQALGYFATSAEARRIMIRTNLGCQLHGLICNSRSVPSLSAAVQLLLVISSDPVFARLCVHLGLLFFMLNERSMSKLIAGWRVCVESLLNADLSMKFAYTGRLSLRNVTLDGFHVLRHISCPFPTLDDLFRLKLCPLQPIYVANFGEPVYNDEFDYLSGKCAAFNAAREAMRRESLERGVRVSEATINAWLELKFGRLQPDPDLVACLELFKTELAASEEADGCGCRVEEDSPGISQLVRAGKIATRARLLGLFVARHLSGPGPAGCLEEQLELHLRALRERLETSVIPIGLLRIGSHLERAILFKVIADRIGLPACLVRGSQARSWVEVPAAATSPHDCSSDEPLPVRYLRQNFIIDLVDRPGELLPIGHPQAERYQESRPTCGFACCEQKNPLRQTKIYV